MFASSTDFDLYYGIMGDEYLVKFNDETLGKIIMPDILENPEGKPIRFDDLGEETLRGSLNEKWNIALAVWKTAIVNYDMT
jgi:hypothetical protein